MKPHTQGTNIIMLIVPTSKLAIPLLPRFPPVTQDVYSTRIGSFFPSCTKDVKQCGATWSAIAYNSSLRST
eukprot:scaffold956_cov389-Pavlova_lutheri.AAC.11